MDEVKSEIYKYFYLYIYLNVLYDIKNVYINEKCV